MSRSPTLVQRLLRPLLVNDVETGESEWYPELKPRRYREAYDEILACARRAIEEGARFQLRSVAPDEGRLEAEARTKLIGFVDDITVSLERDDGEVEISIRSRSRVGQGDMGQNARTIRELYDRIEECLV
jgi:uncharacterized protein (DUF1499 family)